MFRSATAITPFYFSPQLSFRRGKAAGPNWAALPSAAGFVDPLLSTGFALTLLGVARLGEAFQHANPNLSAYERQTFTELDAAADLVSALYSKISTPGEFALLSFLYFAAMSFTETAWRLEKPHLASGFLLTNNPDFSAARSRLCAHARAGHPISRDAIATPIEPFDLAGLTDWSRNHWYPVDFADLLANAHKLNADQASLDALIAKLTPPGSATAPRMQPV
jgi:FADH2 O2-dependent halogenase